MTTQNANGLDQALQEADAAITSSSAYKAAKAERLLNKLGDSVSDIAGSDYASFLQSDAAASTFSLVKDEVANFADNSRILMSALDEVAKFHPFIQVAVSLFKAALTLELTRRENDDKVLALNATMCDMMSILTLLKRVASSNEADSQGLSIEDRLAHRMGAIVESIKTSAKVCDSYHKRNLAIKVFTSAKWQAKFTQVAEEFATHKAELQLTLQMYTTIGVAATNETLANMSQNIGRVMEMVFTLMRSPEERELANFISSRPGGVDAVLKSDNLLRQVIAKQRPAKQGGLAASAELDQPLTVTSLQRAAKQDVETVIAENKFFDEKFDAMRAELEEVKRIVDRDLYHIWKEMGWKGSVKAKHLVMAIRDHFAEESHTALEAIRDLTKDNDENPQTVAQMMSQVAEIARRATPSHDDAWALQYITVSRVQPLIEAIDDDVSSFVTVSEINAFTSTRPVGWSLPRWVAYWTYGFEMALDWYRRRIRALFCSIHVASHSVLPANRAALNQFLSSAQVSFVENLLSGLHSGDGRTGADWDWDSVFTKFKDYVVGNENLLAKRLSKLKYLIDEANTLTVLVVGRDRPEAYVLPLAFLLLRRSLFIIRQASGVMLHPDELVIIQRSLQTVWEAVADRVGTLRAMFKFQNLNNAEQLDNFSFGLYSQVFDKVKMSPFWEVDPAVDSYQITSRLSGRAQSQSQDDLNLDLDAEELPLCYDTQVEELDLAFNGRANAGLNIFDTYAQTDADTSASLIGHWGGSYSYGNGIGSDGFVSFNISVHDEDGTIRGDGMDACGPFTIAGTLAEGSIAFIKDYAILQEGEKIVWYYEAEVQGGGEAMDGSWGLPRSVMPHRFGSQSGPSRDPQGYELPPPGSQTDPLVSLGTFSMQRRPIEYFLACPPAEEFKRNRPRARWRLAINAAIHNLRSRRLDWATLSARRDLRQRYVALEVKRRMHRYQLEPQEQREREDLLTKIHPDDVHAWTALSMSQMRREVTHRDSTCNACQGSPVYGSRLFCIDCTREIGKTTEFCSTCFSNQAHAFSPPHNFVQLRTIKLRLYLFSSLNAAKRLLTYCSNADSGQPVCAECTEVIKDGQPQWCCLECDVLTYVCASATPA